MADKAWKASERRHAKALGTERIPVTGRQRDLGGSDYEDGLVCYSNKYGYAQPGYILGWLNAVCGYAERQGEGKVGCVVWQKSGARTKDSLVVMKFSDWVQLHGEVKDGE